MGVQRRERLWKSQEMSESFIEELDLKELTSFGQVEISVATDMSRIKHKVCGKVWFIGE